MTRFFAQGDILIEQISSMSTLALARGRGRAKSAVIAEGEASGHCHRLVGEFVFYRDDHLARDIPDQLYLGHVRVGRSRAQLLHEEHATVALNPGVYRVRRQRQLEPSDDGFFEDSGIVGD
jgi:hypothetical protein